MSTEIIESINIGNAGCAISVRAGILDSVLLRPFEYNCGEIDFDNIPLHVLAVPFFLNVAPVLWSGSGHFQSRYLDPVLADSLESIRMKWRERDGPECWRGCIESSMEPADAFPTECIDTAVMLYSGGVDSVYTSLACESEKKALILVRGNDIELENRQSWDRAKRLASVHARRIDADLFKIESNMHEFINQRVLDKTLPGSASWWGSVQHGMGLTGLMAAPCWILGATRALIAATHSAGFEGKAWGSMPDTDELIRWENVRVEHHGYESSRQEKVQRIISFADNNDYKMEWRVCFRTTDGGNCSKCEKCLRTGAAIVLEGHSPSLYGLEMSVESLVDRVCSLLESNDLRGDPNTLFHWEVLQKRALDLRSQKLVGNDRRAQLIAALCEIKLDRRRARWAWKERVKLVSDRVFEIVPMLEEPTRKFVERARKLRKSVGLKYTNTDA